MAVLSPVGGARNIAYFSMEIGLDASMPTYSGGLGVLAGDSLRAAADLGLPIVAITLLHRKGYFRQHLDRAGRQTETPSSWSSEGVLEPAPARASVTVEGRDVRVRAWRYDVRGIADHTIPVYMLDKALAENDPRDQTLTDDLYGGDARYRLCQEVVLGIGGVAMLRALGHSDIQTYHMNEGHSALLTLALLEEQFGQKPRRSISDSDVNAVRRRCVFTTHTPVSVGHDRFPLDLVTSVIGEERGGLLARLLRYRDGVLNLTSLAMLLSRSANAVSVRHGKVSRVMFPEQSIGAITNGVHAGTWVSRPFSRLYDRHISDWRSDNSLLRTAVNIPVEAIRLAHAQTKRDLLTEVERRTKAAFDPEAFTIGFARRAVGYKRADLLVSDPERLRQIVQSAGPLQVVYAGKAHSRDVAGKAAIERIFAAARALKNEIGIVYLEEYDIALAKLLVSGVDLWLNTPQKPLEASGTSGMKAALNGVPSLSVLDGWWLEGCVEGVTGWAIGNDSEEPADPAEDAEALYDKLERTIMPMYYDRYNAYTEIMRSAIARNGSIFNAQRMMQQYMQEVYEPGLASTPGSNVR